MLPYIDYRNAKYQGPSRNFLPEGTGILLDDTLSLAISIWKAGQANGPTLIFYSHSKYIYGSWQQGLPHGLNVLRSGDNVVFAFYERGNITNKFLVVFENQKLAATVQMEGKACSIIGRKENYKEEDIRSIVDRVGFRQRVPDQYLSLISYIKKSFPPESKLKFEEERADGNYFLGYAEGLGLTFDADNFINCIGVLDESQRPCELGSRFTLNISEQGNFQDKTIIKYSRSAQTARPLDKIKTIFCKSQMRQMKFRNDYLANNFQKVMQDTESILKKNLIFQVAQQQLEDEVRYVHHDFNDSLEEQQNRNHLKQDNDLLKRIREDIGRSNRPGADIIASPKKEYGGGIRYDLSPSRNIDYDEVPNVYISRPRMERSPNRSPLPVVMVNRQELLDENLLQDYQIGQIKYQNLQERRNRVLNDYRHLRTEAPMVIGAPLPPPPVVVGLRPLYDSPGKNLLLDMEKDAAPLSSSRRFAPVPVLHQRPWPVNNPNPPGTNEYTRKSPYQSPHRATKFDSYKKIHLKDEEAPRQTLPNAALKHANSTTPVRQIDDLKKETPTLTRDRSAKKYNYLQGIER